VIDAVEELAPAGFHDIEMVLSHAEREAIVRGYAKKAGFAKEQLAPARPARFRRGDRRSAAP
jgi:hypothetical protein